MRIKQKENQLRLEYESERRKNTIMMKEKLSDLNNQRVNEIKLTKQQVVSTLRDDEVKLKDFVGKTYKYKPQTPPKHHYMSRA